MKQKKNKREFSKTLLIQESVLIWIMSISFIILAFYCITLGFMGSLPWLAAMVGCPWTAYAVSQTFYYKKAMIENKCGGIKYETALAEINKTMYKEDNYEYTYNATDNVDEYRI